MPATIAGTLVYTESGMLDYINVAQPMIVQFFPSSYRAMPPPRQYVFAAEAGPFVQSACQGSNGSHLQDANAYDYCPAAESIYLRQPFMWSLYPRQRRRRPTIEPAREWGHNVQHQVGVREPKSSAESVNHEDQADCMAGAWIRYAIQQGWFEEDIGSTERLLISITGC
jgi:hypothetical protein